MPKTSQSLNKRDRSPKEKTENRALEKQSSDSENSEEIGWSTANVLTNSDDGELGSRPKKARLTAKPYNIGPLANKLLYALDKVERGEMKGEDLGRTIRLSRAHRATLYNGIGVCTEKAMLLMQGDPTAADLHMGRKHVNPNPEEADYYLTLVQRLAKIQKLADEDGSDKAFPILQLPAEVRDMIYRLAMSSQEVITIKACDEHYDKPDVFLNSTVSRFREDRIRGANLALMHTCRQIREEASASFYRFNSFDFPCTCAMSSFFCKCDPYLSSKIRYVSFYWRGFERIHAISSLGNLANLTVLQVYLDMSTSSMPSERELMLRERLVLTSSRKPLRLVDSLGFEELMELRGLDVILLLPDRTLRRNKRLKTEVDEIEMLLQDVVSLPRTPVN
ncbi:MAG: hypothetical protein M1818_000418 [Claussenomyces sp. TS43310]|nr:MAG: hypothetical protein M1818_000418 [Claussenomyces sp. TS43310]